MQNDQIKKKTHTHIEIDHVYCKICNRAKSRKTKRKKSIKSINISNEYNINISKIVSILWNISLIKLLSKAAHTHTEKPIQWENEGEPIPWKIHIKLTKQKQKITLKIQEKNLYEC